MRRSLNRSYSSHRKEATGLVVTITEAGDPVITANDLQAYLRELSELEQEQPLILQDMIATAQQMCTQYLNASPVPQKVRARWQNIDRTATIPWGPVIEIFTVKQEFGDGTTRTLTEGQDYLISGGTKKQIELISKTFSTSSGSVRSDRSIIIDYEAGYPETSPYRPAIRMAVRKLAADLYMMRNTMSEVALHASAQTAFEPLKIARIN